MSRYKDVSRQVFGIFHDYTPLVQGLSLDEAFLDVTASQSLHGDVVAIARAIKARVLAQTGCTASVGVAPNKLVAKIGSDLNKPDGLVVITPDCLHAVLDPLSVRRLPGLGRKLGGRVEQAGLSTLGELRRAPDAVLWPLFGRDSKRMRDRAGGIDDRPVLADWDEQSISAEETFGTDISDPARLMAELAQLADRAATRLRDKELNAACVTVKIRRADFQTYTRQRRFEPPSNDTRLILRIAAPLLRHWLTEQPRAKIRLLGVGISHLTHAQQPDLFAATSDARTTALDSALDRIRERFGTQAVRRGSSLPADPLEPD